MLQRNLVKKGLYLLWSYGAFFLLIACYSNSNNKPTPSTTIKVAAAASTQPVLQALQELYQQQHAVQFENYVQASGKLTAQIEQGAAIDIFLSADSLYPAYLQEQGRTARPSVVYARGTLALWSRDKPLGAGQNWSNFSLLPSERLVLADPKAAPYGKLAQQALQAAGVAQSMPTQLVYGQNIEQVNLYLYNELVDFGLTAHSSLLHPKLKGKGHFLLLPHYQLPQAVALIQPLEGEVSKAAQQFYEFLQSAEAQQVLLDYGYALP